ncbi:MAG: glutamine--fructose-6-phosphate transaminase (isomerizing) [Theionarchaea archaeon]|nr:glutamine--fructose-6-phosphate transaminase (isomerizing) [Theionarchaea archaeon]MBU7037093.1 glutamine--fructose-6-phosphate transaminase (isomerizing) [Theionarchaea archaeon]
MCGIVGMISREEFTTIELLKALKRLEYRGYDSVGYATVEGSLQKDIGEIDDFLTTVPEYRTRAAISHTRWATHGGVTRENAHPHAACNDQFFIVHNGIIENYERLRDRLQDHHFMSETDTEVIAHFIEEKMREGFTIKESIDMFMAEAKGTYAVLLLPRGEEKIYAFKKDSPLVLGLLPEGFVVSSDIFAFSERSQKAIFFEDYEMAEVTATGYTFFKHGTPIAKEIREFKVTYTEIEKDFPHYMIKEIHEQPVVAERLVTSLKTDQAHKLDVLSDLVRQSRKVVFVAAGTSYHASLLGVHFFHDTGVETQTIIASEFRNYVTCDEETLIIAISQSGETMDVLKALKHAREQGARIASIVNVPYSTIQRMSELSIEILTGQEICVASTKTYTNQVITLLALAQKFGYVVNLDTVSRRIKECIDTNEEQVKILARELRECQDIYLIGRGLSYPVARESALKLKEIAYVHAEGMMGGELKHGTIALIEDGTPVVCLIPDEDFEMESNTKEVQARGARTIIISNNSEFSPDFLLETSSDGKFAILATVIGQMLAYYIARERGLPIDKPRNLAKSVTVE